MENRKALMGNTFATFAGTILVIIVLIVFIAGAGLIKSNSTGLRINTPAFTAELSEYMASFRELFMQRAPNQKDQGGCCSAPGEKFIGGICKCDSTLGYTSKKNPLSDYTAPCIFIQDSTARHAMDESLALTDSNKKDEGLCVGYYSQKYLAGMQAQYPNSPIAAELLRYPGDSRGFVLKVHKPMMDALGKNYGSQLVTRENCQKYAGSFKAEEYAVFYTSWEDNLKQGYLDDSGYCATFNAGGEAVQISASTREKCLEHQKEDATEKYSFFVEKQGAQKYFGTADKRVDLWFTENIDVSKGRKELPEQEVKGACIEWGKYDLTYIMGYSVSLSNFPSVKSDQCMREQSYLRSKIAEYKGLPAFYTGKIAEIGGNKFCCYMTGYGSTK
jgi:hypothetical protein